MFYTLDFVLFGAFLLLSLFVGLYHGIAARLNVGRQRQNQKRTHTKTDEFLTGGRSLPIIPVCLSLLSTFTSGIGLLSVPAEIYIRGYTWGLSYVTGALAFPLIGALFIPVFYKLQFLNAYEYFEMRFRCVSLRRMASLLFMINTMIYLAVVVYAPAIALTNITGMNLWPLILAVGGVCTIYTAAGGIKAVIWTDTLQAIFIYVGLGWLLIKGTIDSGGFMQVLKINEATGRLTEAIFRLDLTLLQYNSAWISVIGGLLHWLSSYGLNQMAIQRYCSMPSLKDARTVLWLAMPAILLIGYLLIKLLFYILKGFMKCYIGILMGAYFGGCDPLSLGEIQTVDQMTILMADRVLSNMPGLPGLFLATIFSATLKFCCGCERIFNKIITILIFFGTISSGINSLTTVLWEDFLKSPFGHLSDSGAEIVIKALTLIFGIIAIAMAFACYNLGGIFHVCVTILGATTGPLVGLFFLGIFFPGANKHGAIVGLIASTVIMLACTIMNNIDMPYKNYVLPHKPENYTSPGCIVYSEDVRANLSITQAEYYTGKGEVYHYGSSNAHYIALVSPFAYAALGVFFVILIGLPISYLFPQKLTEKDKKFAYACTYQGLDEKLDETILAKKEAIRRASIDLRAKLSIQSATENMDPLIQ